MNVDMKDLANAIRILSIDTLVNAGEGHPGTPLGGADIATVLFTKHLKFDPSAPTWTDRDRFVHSAGHGSMLLYSLLYLCGYQVISLEQIKRFRVLGSRTPGHPEYDPEAGIETTTGPLGQGIANAAGMAVAERILNYRFGDAVIDHFTYAYVGDGCLMEGIAAEIIALAGHLKLGKLIFLWDDNRITDDGSTNLALSENTAAKFEASGWHVQSIDGHDLQSISDAIGKAKTDDRPSVIACRTIIGKGIPRVQDQRVAHGMPIDKRDAEAARRYLNWPYPPFEIPDEIFNAWRQAGKRGRSERQAWEDRLNNLSEENRAEFERVMSGDLPLGWHKVIADYKVRKANIRESQSTVLGSGELLSNLAEVIPELISGAPDLEGTTQHKQQLEAFSCGNRGGRYIHYGVREHAMGAMLNGMVLHGGVRAVGVTYLVFSDYMRHTLRLAALMEIPSIFIFSHDSIGLGSNGATHQPVECLASLRAYPNLWTLRPADVVELAECWELALRRTDGPCAIICSRQTLPILRTSHRDDNFCRKGAYILSHAEGGNHKVTLLATGSEVSIALKAREILQRKNLPTRVVSMPSWELFEKQCVSYRQAVLGNGTIRLAIEAAVRFGWDRYIGEDGIFIGMQSFGASGQADDLFRHFSITADAVVSAVEERCLQS